MNEARPTLTPARPTIAPAAKPIPAQPLHPQPAHPPIHPPQPANQLPKVGALPTQNNKVDEAELDPIGLVEEIGAETEERKIKAFGVVGAQRAREWKRKPTVTGQGAVRLKSFHGKLSDQGMQYIDDAVNEWLDAHPEVEVKFVTSTVGQFEGKIREPALILNLWY
jgi:hypothetical protein